MLHKTLLLLGEISSTSTKKVAKKMWWKNMKMNIILAIAILACVFKVFVNNINVIQITEIIKSTGFFLNILKLSKSTAVIIIIIIVSISTHKEYNKKP